MSDEDAQAASAPQGAAPDMAWPVVALLKGVVYQEADAALWSQLYALQPQVRDYVAVLGLELVLDEAEGYAFLRSRAGDAEAAPDDAGPKRPRLIARRPLTFPVSLILALLRKKLAEFDAGGGDTRLVLSRDDIVEMVRVFMPDGSNEVKLIDQVDTHLNKIMELGFVRRLKPATASQPAQAAGYEVRRILKAYVDAQWLAEFDARLGAYRDQLAAGTGDGGDD